MFNRVPCIDGSIDNHPPQPLQASQHDEACGFKGGGLFASPSPLDGRGGPVRAKDTPERANGVRSPDQSPQHKRHATPGSVRGAHGVQAGGSPLAKRREGADEGREVGIEGMLAPRSVVSGLQQEHLLRAGQQLSEQQRQAQIPAWAARVNAEGRGGAGVAVAKDHGGDGRRRGAYEHVEEDGEDWAAGHEAVLQSTGRVLFG